MPSTLTKILSALVPIFGLVSCTQNQQPDVADTWQLPAPQFQRPTQNEGAPQALSEISDDAVLPDSDIVFSNDKSANKDPDVTMQISSSCTVNSQHFKQNFTTNGVVRVPVLSLVPKSIWLNLGLENLSAAVCTFDFVASNNVGSTYKFTVPNVHFAQPEVLQTIQLTAFANNHNFLEGQVNTTALPVISSTDSTLFRVATSDSQKEDLEAKRDFDLICDHLQNYRERESHESSETVMNELINGNVQNRDQKSPSVDPRAAFTKQTCKIVVQATDEPTGVTHVSMSRTFKLNFPRAGAEISSQLLFQSNSNVITKVFGNQPFLTLSIHNPTTAPLAFSYPVVRNRSISFEGVGTSGGNIFVGQAVPETFSVSINGESRQIPAGGDLVFEVAPGTTAVITASVDQHFACMAMDPFLGLAYRTDADLHLRQFENWDSQAPNIAGDTDDVANFFNGGSDLAPQIFSGWISATAMNGERPTQAILNHPSFGVGPKCMQGDTVPGGLGW